MAQFHSILSRISILSIISTKLKLLFGGRKAHTEKSLAGRPRLQSAADRGLPALPFLTPAHAHPLCLCGSV